MSAGARHTPGDPAALGIHELHVRITGRVQGVGYRAFVRATADTLGIAGWVCNHPDGSVEVAGQGPVAAIRALIDALRRGPVGAQVTGLEPLSAVVLDPAGGFEVRRGPQRETALSSDIARPPQ